jgi:hypothetical protein
MTRPTDKEIARVLRKAAMDLWAVDKREEGQRCWNMALVLEPPVQVDRPDAPRETGFGAYTGD